METIIKVHKFILHEDGIHRTTEEQFVAVPTQMYDEALAEKKMSANLNSYAYSYERGGLPKYTQLKKYAEMLVKGEISIEIQRIKIVR